MSLSIKNVEVITLFAEDLARTKAFYQEIFGLPVVFEDENSTVFRFGNMTVNLLDATAAPGLIGPASVADPEAGARFQFTAYVADVDVACAELARLGVKLLNGPMDRPWGIRTASFTDPAGHIWEIAHDLPGSE
jgi:catechol 2,3-dioxygenase-like lactoylglutathione lyase family enzyme